EDQAAGVYVGEDLGHAVVAAGAGEIDAKVVFLGGLVGDVEAGVLGGVGGEFGGELAGVELPDAGGGVPGGVDEHEEVDGGRGGWQNRRWDGATCAHPAGRYLAQRARALARGRVPRRRRK